MSAGARLIWKKLASCPTGKEVRDGCSDFVVVACLGGLISEPRGKINAESNGEQRGERGLGHT